MVTSQAIKLMVLKKFHLMELQKKLGDLLSSRNTSLVDVVVASWDCQELGDARHMIEVGECDGTE